MEYPILITDKWIIYMTFSDGINRTGMPINVLGTRILIDKELFQFHSRRVNDTFRHCVRGNVIFFKVLQAGKDRKGKPQASRIVDCEPKFFRKHWPNFFNHDPRAPYNVLEAEIYAPNLLRNPLNDLLMIDQVRFHESKVLVEEITLCIKHIQHSKAAGKADRAYSWVLGVVLLRLHRPHWTGILPLTKNRNQKKRKRV